MSGMDRLTDEALIAGWDSLKDNLPSDGHGAAEALFDYGDKLADALFRRASQAAPAPSDGLREENERLREYYEAREAIRKVGILNMTDEMSERLDAARTALTSAPAQEGGRT